MDKKNIKFDWNQFLNLKNSIDSSFYDERNLYKTIRRKNIDKLRNHNKSYTLLLIYDCAIERFLYAEILSKYFSVSKLHIAEYIVKLENNKLLLWNNLSSSIADLMVIEIQKFLVEQNIEANIIIKKVIEDAVKKPGNYSA